MRIFAHNDTNTLPILYASDAEFLSFLYSKAKQFVEQTVDMPFI